MTEMVIFEHNAVNTVIDGGMKYLVFETPFTLIAGKTYRVVFDNEEYNCTAAEANMGGTDGIGIGNFGLMGLGENTAEPFLIGTAEGEAVGITTSELETLPITIYLVSADGEKYIIQGSTLRDIADAIREKTGETASMKPTEFSSKIRNITGGGGGSGDATVYFVTFKNGDTVLFKMPVLAGDDCKDPITTGDIATPTKDSSAQYDYTYSGWALTVDGAADSSALSAVTEDKTVYAAFTASTRKYTIRFYDGETLLTSMQVDYGDTPVYTTEKDGYNFEGWSPEIEAVTSDADYYAQWSSALTFAGASWADIARISEAGEAASTFKVGDTRSEIIGDKTVTLEIIGFNHDDLADGTGKAGITIWCTTNYSSVSRSQLSCPWFTSNLHTNHEEAMFNDMSAELQAVVKSVNKKYGDSMYYSANIKTGSAKVWSLSRKEIGVTLTADSNQQDNGYRYADRFPEITAGSSSLTYTEIHIGVSYWLRDYAGGSYACINTASGNTASNLSFVSTSASYSSTTKALCPCFCV